MNKKMFTKIVDSAKSVKKELTRHNLYDAVRDYIASTLNNTTEQYVQELTEELQEAMNTTKDDERGIIVQQVIFLNLLGYDTTWADFMILEVMSSSNYSMKRICYTAAGFMWSPNCDAVFMSTNRVHKDLTTVNPLVTSSVLSGISTCLSEPLAQHVASDIISLMSSARPDVRQKAICVFYQVCLKYPEALKAGFPALKARLEDPDPSVLFAALNVMAEFCRHNPANFTSLIPRFFKMLDASPNNWVTLKLIYLLRMLCEVEPRLPRKLINPFTNILETTASITVLFECVRTIIEVPITNTVLLTYATQRMQNFLEHEDANLRFLCLTLFIKLMEIQPKLVAQHKEIISSCLDSNDEATRLLALDLLASLANKKTIDGIIGKMFAHFKESLSTAFKDTIVRRVIEVCSKNDYALITDFEWYISIIGDFLQEGGFTCTDIVADQFMDLATRVPSTRPALIEEMGTILSMRTYRDATKLLLSALYIIAEYSENSDQLATILSQNMMYCDERVQVSALSTAFKLYIRCDSPTAFAQAEALFAENLDSFQSGIYAEVQDIAIMTRSLIDMLKEVRETEAFVELRDRLTEEFDEEDLPELEIPEELEGPDEDFKCSDDEDDDFLQEEPVDDIVEQTAREVKKQVKEEKKKSHIRVRKQKNVANRENIVIKKSRKSLLHTQAQEKKANPLADAIANIDLTEEEPVQMIAPKTYGSPKAPVVLEKPSKPIKLRQKRNHGKEAAQPVEKKHKEPPVSGPLDGARAQKLCDTESITVTALEFTPEKQAGQLTIKLEIKNKTEADMSSVGIEVVTESITGISVLPTTEVQKGKSVTTTITIEVPNPTSPAIAKLRFIPVSASADSVDADLKIFPSFFLIPGKVSEIDSLSLEEKGSYTLVLTAKPREMLQRMVNVLRGPIIAQEVKTAKLIYAKTADEKHVTALLSLDGQTATVDVSSDDSQLCAIICKELKMKTTPLTK